MSDHGPRRRCVREPSGRLVCYSPLTDGSALRACWWDDGPQLVLDEGPIRVSPERHAAWRAEWSWLLDADEVR